MCQIFPHKLFDWNGPTPPWPPPLEKTAKVVEYLWKWAAIALYSGKEGQLGRGVGLLELHGPGWKQAEANLGSAGSRGVITRHIADQGFGGKG